MKRYTKWTPYLLVVIVVALLVGSITLISFAEDKQTSTPELSIKTFNLSLENAVYINFKVKNSGVKDPSSIQILAWDEAPAEYRKGTETVVLSTTGTESGTGYEIFQYDQLAAKEMTKMVYVCAYVNQDGVETYSSPAKFSVAMYAYMKSHAAKPDTALVKLMDTMLTYGAQAQLYFNYNTDFLANDPMGQVTVQNGLLPDGFSLGWYKAGTTVTLTANQPENGYEFSHWENTAGERVSDDEVFEAPVTEGNQTYTAIYVKSVMASQGLSFTTNTADGTYSVSGIGTCTDTDIVISGKHNGKRVTAIGARAFYECSTLTSIMIPNSVTSIGREAFYGCTGLTSITFTGSVAQWNAISKGNSWNKLTGNYTVYCTDGTIHNVTLNATEGGTVSGAGSYSNGSTVTASAQSKLGYTFLGWYDANGSLVSTKESYSFTIESSGITLTAKWTINTYNISYVNNGGVHSNVTTYTVEDEIILVAPEKVGYTFLGWTYEGQDTPVISVKIPKGSTGNKAYTANWKIDTYTITYVNNGGTHSNATTYTVEDEVVLVAPERTGYTFLGWTYEGQTSPVLNVKINKGSIGDKIYTANWSVNAYTITYNANGGNVTNITQKVSYGATYTLEVPTRTGYTFAGWYNGETLYSNNGTWNILSDVTLTAKWTINTYSISYVNGGTHSNATTYTVENEVVLTAPTKTGYTFLGWTYEGQTTPVLNVKINKGSVGDRTYTANWSINSYNVTVNGTDGGDIDGDGSYNYNSNVTLSARTYLGYTFLGWYDANNQLISTNQTYSFTIGTSNVTLNAKWKISDDMADFNFTSTETTCEITSAKDKTKTAYTIPAYVTSIGRDAFNDCHSLTSIVIPDSVTSIGRAAFKDCYELTSVTMSKNVTVIDTYAFYECSKLESITIPSGVTQIGDYAFFKCKLIDSIIIPDGVTSIGNFALSGCESITTLVIPDSVTSIGKQSIGWCSNLTSVTLSKNLKVIPDSAFAGCGALVSVIIPDGVTSIGIESFYKCMKLESIIIPDSVTSIGTKAFQHDRALTSITIPKGVTSIGDNAFYDCQKLATIIFKDTEEVWGNVTLGADWNYRVPATEIIFYDPEPKVIVNSANGGSVSGTGKYLPGASVTVSATTYPGYTWIGWYDVNDKLLSSNTSYSFTMGGYTVTLKPKWQARDEMADFNFTSTESTCTITGVKDKTKTSYTIPEYVTSIGQNAFNSCTNLQSIVIPNGVTSLNYRAFYQCTALTSISLPDSLLSIGDYAFYKCTSLQSITIPSSVTSIGAFALSGCSSITTLVIPDSVEVMGSNAVSWCTALTSITISKNITTMSDTMLAGCTALTSVVVPDGVIMIENHVFYKCTNLQSVTLPDSVTIIGASAFQHASSLNNIVIPQAVAYIDDLAFSGCKILHNITFKGTVEDWRSIVFGADWRTSVTATEIICADGIIICSNGVTKKEPAVIINCTDGGSFSYLGRNSVTFFEMSISADTKPGYKFLGWYDEHGILISEDQTYSFTVSSVDLLLTAKWEMNGDMSDFNVTSTESSCTITGVKDKTKTSYTISNQVTRINGYVFSDCSNLTTIFFRGTMAQWKALSLADSWNYNISTKPIVCSDGIIVNKRTVSVNCTSGGSFNAIGSTEGSTVTVTAKTYLGYTFLGWYNASNTLLSADQEYSFSLGTSDITLVAKWETSDEMADFEFVSTETTCKITAVKDKTKTAYTIPEYVTSIGNYAFSDCGKLISLTIPDGVSFIGAFAFENCTSLTAIKIPEGVKSIGTGTFYGLRSLTSIVIPNGVMAIGPRAFAGCSSFTSIIIPEGVTSIGSWAFYGCTNVKHITIPSTVNTIGMGAFENCDSINTVTFNGTTDKLYDICDDVLSWCFNTPTGDIICSDGIIVGGYVLTVDCSDGGGFTYLGKDNSSVITLLAKDHYGYNFAGWYNEDDVLLSNSQAYSFTMSKADITLYAKWTAKPDMSDFIFTSSDTDCTITGVKDKTKTTYTIPEGVTAIGWRAFADCPNLTSITIPDSVTSIGWWAFFDCTALTSVEIPESVAEIGHFTFSGCTSLEYVDIPEGVTSIGWWAFADCTSLKSVTIPSSVTYIGWWAFSDCSALESVEISNGLTYIGWWAFSDCTSITSIDLPESVTYIGWWAFADCASLNDINIPEGVTHIGWYAFADCVSLESIDIPDSVSYIGWRAFADCTGLTSIDLPDGVRSIGWHAFAGCSALTKTELPDGVRYIGWWAYADCTSLTEAEIPEGVTSIGRYAFENCTGLATVYIPESVTSIGKYAFAGCTNLEKIFFNGTRGEFDAICEGSAESLFDGNMPEIICSDAIIDTVYPITVNCSDGGSFSYVDNTPNSTVTILAKGRLGYTFLGWYDDNGNLLSTNREYSLVANRPNIVLNGEWKISDEMADFIFTSSETTCEINGVQDQTKTAYVIPEYVTSLGRDAFNDCYNLKSIVIPDSVTSIGRAAFKDCYELTSVTMSKNVTLIDAYAFYECSKLENIALPSGITKINDYTFFKCKLIDSITIPSGVTSIGNFALSGCESIKTLIIPDSVTSIGKQSIGWCSSLTSVTISKNIKTIPDSAFAGCSSLTGSIIPDGVTSIGAQAFYKCFALESVFIPDSVTSIGAGAFQHDWLLNDVTIPNSVTSIGDQAFYDCKALTTLIFKGTETAWNSITFGTDWNAKVPATEIIFSPLNTIVTIKGTSGGGITGAGSYAEGASVTASATTYTGYVWLGWYDISDNLLSAERSYSFTVGTSNLTLKPKWQPRDEMTDFEFTSTESTCTITGVKDKTKTSYAIPEYVTSIGYDAFGGCGKLLSITIPASVKTIDTAAFCECISLTSVVIHEGITSIGSMVFSGCISLTDVSLPESLTSIDRYAFYYCISLEGITVPGSVTSIDDSAFHCCRSLTSISFGGTTSEWSEMVFGADHNYSFPANTIICPDGAFNRVSLRGEHTLFIHSTKGGLVSVSDDLNDHSYVTLSANSQPGYNFLGWYDANDNLLSTNKSYSFTIGDADVTLCPKWQLSDGLSEFTFKLNKTTCTITGVKDKTKTVYVIPEGVTAIGNFAFSGCSNLTGIVLPDSVISLGHFAFSGCSGLTAITIPGSVTTIGCSAFSGCTSLTSIVIPESVTAIDHFTFSGCSSLVSVTIPQSVESIGWKAFANCTSLTEVTIPNGMIRIGWKAFSGCTGLTTATISDTVQRMAWGVFSNCTSLKNVTLSKSVTYISHFAFLNCTSLESIDIPERVTSIGHLAFKGCTNLTDINIPECVTYIGHFAFSECTNLAGIAIPESVKYIGHFAFKECTNLQSITIPDGVTRIGWYAFLDCTNLRSITIPDSVVNIFTAAFNDCTSLEAVYYIGTTEDWANVTIGNYNSELADATVYYYSVGQPTDTAYNYWRYVGGVPTKW